LKLDGDIQSKEILLANVKELFAIHTLEDNILVNQASINHLQQLLDFSRASWFNRS
jgi:hypothetical protein